jgi:hypothetical protein
MGRFGYGESEVYEHTGLLDDDYGRGHKCQRPGYDHGDRYGHDDDEPPILCLLDPTDPIPTYVHPCFFTPAPIPHARHVPKANQRGHVTASNHTQDTHELTRAGYNTGNHACTDYDTAEPTHTLCYTPNPTLTHCSSSESSRTCTRSGDTRLFDEYCSTSSPTYA